MKRGLYFSLARNSIRANRRLYTPYILTSVGMAAMYYIVLYLSGSGILTEARGADFAQNILKFGSMVIAAFSLIFLFYTNSFLVRRRKMEFGLYNILGMGKRNIARIIVWESVITYAITIFAGGALGVALSKLAELGYVKIMGGKATYSFSLSPTSFLMCAAVFAVISLLIFLNTLRQVGTADPITLLHSENAGERAPRGNTIIGLLGVITLVCAYIIAISVKDPVSALGWFFIAVLMVIVGTYLSFISASVVICRLLKKSKNYYYKPQHFVSVSSMAYRMKRNGAGLASICILGTMVLVMIATTASMYIGVEDGLRTRYPREIEFNVYFRTTDGLRDENLADMRHRIDSVLSSHGGSVCNTVYYRDVIGYGAVLNGTPSIATGEQSDPSSNDTFSYRIFSLDEYNRISGRNATLGAGEALICPDRNLTGFDRLKIGDREYSVTGTDELFLPSDRDHLRESLTYMCIVINDIAEPSLVNQSTDDETSDNNDDYTLKTSYCMWNFSFDTGVDEEEQLKIRNDVCKTMADITIDEDVTSAVQPIEAMSAYAVSSRADAAEDFYGSTGSLFFLGIMLSITFTIAAVLIIYYKQISEGYEDQSRFAIMQKVGMTKRDIRRSINSQLLTVFFLPLIAAGVHLSFAFPMISKMLVLVAIRNTSLLIATTAVSFLVFALFYTAVYKITSSAYYSIVSDE